MYVHHDYSSLPASAVVSALKSEGFAATLQKDGAPSHPPPPTMPTVGKSTFAIANMCCASEVPPILSILEPMAGVTSVKCNVTAKLVYVEHDWTVVEASTLEDELNKDGFGATTKKAAGYNPNASVDYGSLPNPSQATLPSEPEKQSPYPRWNVTLCGFLWLLSMFAPFFPPPYDEVEYLAILAFVTGIYPIASKTYDSVRRLSIDANLLMFVAAFGAVGLGQYSEAAGLTFLFSLGEWLESKATSKAKTALESIVSLKPETANLKTSTSDFSEVPAEYVRVGDMVLVRTGDKVPVDGDVIKGESLVNESSLTGESVPITKKLGSQVFSGTINIGSSPLTVKCTATTEDSTVSKLIELVEEAQANRSPTEKLVDEFAKRYTPLVVLTSLLMCTVPFAICGKEVGMRWLYQGIVLIVIACPCALIISTPVTYVAGLAATAQRGIIVKGGVHLEALANVRVVCCDKTGTLTHGEFAVLKLDAVGKWKNRKEILRCLAVLERESSHPMASAMVKRAQEEGVTLTSKDQADDHEILKGEGVTGKVNGVRMYAGNGRLMGR